MNDCLFVDCNFGCVMKRPWTLAGDPDSAIMCSLHTRG